MRMKKPEVILNVPFYQGAVQSHVPEYTIASEKARKATALAPIADLLNLKPEPVPPPVLTREERRRLKRERKRKLREEAEAAKKGTLECSKWEDILEFCGFASYREYLKSDLWADIKANVFEAKGRVCVGCGDYSTCIHHRRYDLQTMLGADISALEPICHECHHAIEFDDGEKNNLGRANQKLKQLRKGFRCQ